MSINEKMYEIRIVSLITNRYVRAVDRPFATIDEAREYAEKQGWKDFDINPLHPMQPRPRGYRDV